MLKAKAVVQAKRKKANKIKAARLAAKKAAKTKSAYAKRIASDVSTARALA